MLIHIEWDLAVTNQGGAMFFAGEATVLGAIPKW